jgi:hypothetical protein
MTKKKETDSITKFFGGMLVLFIIAFFITGIVIVWQIPNVSPAAFKTAASLVLMVILCFIMGKG